MKNLEDVLQILESRIDRTTLEHYIEREWLRPVKQESGWHFQEIDIARIELVWHLTQEIKVNDEGMDVVLSLLDQLYGLRAHMQQVTHAITSQSAEVQAEIKRIIGQLNAQDAS